jgi:hypothetical protein
MRRCGWGGRHAGSDGFLLRNRLPVDQAERHHQPRHPRPTSLSRLYHVQQRGGWGWRERRGRTMIEARSSALVSSRTIRTSGAPSYGKAPSLRTSMLSSAIQGRLCNRRVLSRSTMPERLSARASRTPESCTPAWRSRGMRTGTMGITVTATITTINFESRRTGYSSSSASTFFARWPVLRD